MTMVLRSLDPAVVATNEAAAETLLVRDLTRPVMRPGWSHADAAGRIEGAVFATLRRKAWPDPLRILRFLLRRSNGGWNGYRGCFNRITGDADSCDELLHPGLSSVFQIRVRGQTEAIYLGYVEILHYSFQQHSDQRPGDRTATIHGCWFDAHSYWRGPPT